MLGIIFAKVLVEKMTTNDSKKNQADGESVEQVYLLKRNRVTVLLGVYVFLFLLILLRIRKPNELYLQPFYSGCDLKYTDAAAELADASFDVRRLDENADLKICAQFCVPHLVSRWTAMGAKKVFDFPIYDGTCEANGYEDHVADKTFKVLTYSLDVEVYQDGDGSEQEN